MLANDTSRDWTRVKQWDELMLHEPHIATSDLNKIQAPVLIMGGDDDIIPLDHLLEIYRNTPAQLCIISGGTHFMLREEHEIYNLMAERFLRRPFLRPTSKQSLERASD